ncbi:TetR/AcrR family transcriptional regulator [Camelimonas abortus]|uniref:TetR/AcrR family transcriptional regulator n=1 Tax=Camelimonas abortus TaxID=1017184 RepID=A0ABV7LEK4_9HYPH
MDRSSKRTAGRRALPDQQAAEPPSPPPGDGGAAAPEETVVQGRRRAGGGRREAAKAERRQRIIAAARGLIRETGDAGLSMRALAARAGVSLATPYNLFGSKGAILLAVLEDIRGFGQQFSRHAHLSPLERVLKAAEIAVSYYEQDPEFYRVLWGSILRAAGAEERRAIFNPKRAAFWVGLLDAARDDGWLLADIDTGVLMNSLDYIFRAVMLHWINGELELAGLQPGVGYGFALTLRGAATARGEALMLARALAFQQQLQALGATTRAG